MASTREGCGGSSGHSVIEEGTLTGAIGFLRSHSAMTQIIPQSYYSQQYKISLNEHTSCCIEATSLYVHGLLLRYQQ